MSPRVPALLLLVTYCLISLACSQESRANPSASAPAPAGRGGGAGAPVPITVAIVEQKTMPLDLQVIGTVEPTATVAVNAQVTGQLERVHFREGDEVKAGQVLFTLDRRPLEATLRQMQATLQRDTAQAANATSQARRLLDLQARGIATSEQVDTAKANAEALEATLGADRAAIENATIQLQYASITAPISGRTGVLIAHAGTIVRANDATPLVVINQLAPINVAFAVPEAQLAALKRYMSRGNVPLSVTTPEGDAPSSGRVTFVDNTVDQTTGTIRVKGVFGNADHRLWPGQYVNVRLTLSTDQNAIVAPNVAVQSGPEGNYVFVVKADQTVELRPVTIQRTSGNETIIATGLTSGETVVTDGHLRLVPGARVSIKGAGAGVAE